MSFDALGDARYLSLTTRRRDGSAVATPVWVARDGVALVVITGRDSGKVKRIQADPSVTIAPCDVRGRLKGEPVPARASVQDDAGTTRTADLIRRRYGLLGRFVLRGQARDSVGISITEI